MEIRNHVGATNTQGRDNMKRPFSSLTRWEAEPPQWWRQNENWYPTHSGHRARHEAYCLFALFDKYSLGLKITFIDDNWRTNSRSLNYDCIKYWSIKETQSPFSLFCLCYSKLSIKRRHRSGKRQIYITDDPRRHLHFINTSNYIYCYSLKVPNAIYYLIIIYCYYVMLFIIVVLFMF